MKNSFRCRSSSTQVLLALVLFTAGGCLVLKAALFRPEATSTAPQKPLTFANRVTYQRAIEEVYWRHRIWPKENVRSKPSLDEVMPEAQIEKKVEDYLRNSQALEDYWRRPITPDQLQSEMERIASHTKQPEVLRELFAALGNDPLVIAECLARPILTGRLMNDVTAPDEEIRGSTLRRISVEMKTNDAAYRLPEISVPTDCANDTWTPTTLTNAPVARASHSAVWTGSEMIVWGGTAGNTGGRYNPSTDSWTATSTTNAPSSRTDHTAVWTGNEMIIWGGFTSNYVPTGGRYNPSTDVWTATSITNAPTGRQSPTSVWTGSQMIVWGGRFLNGINFQYLNTGGSYDPSTDSWTATSTGNAPAPRFLHTAVWTGVQMIVWGGRGDAGSLNTGGRYDPSTDSWTATSTTNAPLLRELHTAVWTGNQMIVWGGYFGGAELNTGGSYNPSTDSWLATSTTNAPTGRRVHTAVWTGNQMIVWGGFFYDFNTNTGHYLNTGGRYTLSSDSWTATSITDAPSAREAHTAVWTGTEMIVWGGHFQDPPGTDHYVNTGGRYCAQPSAPIVQNAVSRKTHGGAGSFNVNLPLSGTPGIECRAGGATNDYTTVVTFLANVSVNGSPQAAVTAGSGAVGSGGVSNGGVVTISGNVVTIPLTNVSNAQTINLTLNSVNGSTNVVIPMSILIGDTTGNGNVNAGDVSQTKSQIGQATNQTNFRSDVNTNGSINAADVSIVKSSLGTGLP